MEKELKNLKKAIEKLNAPTVIDGMELESNFDFKVEKRNGQVVIYDRNECYYIGYAEDSYYMAREAAFEFGFEPPTEMTDRVMEQLEEAVKKDFGKGAYIDWYDSVRMIVGE